MWMKTDWPILVIDELGVGVEHRNPKLLTATHTLEQGEYVQYFHSKTIRPKVSTVISDCRAFKDYCESNMLTSSRAFIRGPWLSATDNDQFA